MIFLNPCCSQLSLTVRIRTARLSTKNACSLFSQTSTTPEVVLEIHCKLVSSMQKSSLTLSKLASGIPLRIISHYSSTAKESGVRIWKESRALQPPCPHSQPCFLCLICLHICPAAALTSDPQCNPGGITGNKQLKR